MYIVSDVPGRLRLKLEKFKNRPEQLGRTKQWLMMDGVHRITTTPLTGSVVVEYDRRKISSKDVVEILVLNNCPVKPKPDKRLNHKKKHEQIAVKVGKATLSWLAGQVLEANGLSYIAAFI